MDYEVTIVGAGIVGLACAYFLSKKFSTIVVERNPSFGLETSSRNSEVIHSGIYYTPGSLKAKLCVEGNHSIYQWCENYNIPSAKTGKLIVATTEEEVQSIHKLRSIGLENGVENIQFLTEAKAKQLEPNIICKEALLVPSTGIFDTHRFMESLFILAKQNGADFAFHHKLFSVHSINNGYEIGLKTDANDLFKLSTRFLVNSAGLESDTVAEMVGLNVDSLGYRIRWAKGHYFRLATRFRNFANHLIYPVPPTDTKFLGVHLTIELSGGIKFGPDLHYLDKKLIDYSVPENLKTNFYNSISSYLKGISPDDLSPDQAGIRPKLASPKSHPPDFIIAEESKNGFPGFVNLIGIESPGLTCSLEIGKMVLSLLDQY